MKTIVYPLLILLAIQSVMAQSITLAPAIPGSPTKGTVVFDNATNLLKYWNGTAWIPVTNAAAGTGWALNGTHIYNGNAGNVGIGVTSPKAAFHIGAGKTVLFGADSSGSGSKLIWYPSKGAFRAGGVPYYAETSWNYENIGLYSIGLGNNTLATGNYSIAIGSSAKALGSISTAMGGATKASGMLSTAMGFETTASGEGSTAIGVANTASGHYSTAMGLHTTAFGENSTTMGYYSLASGRNSTAMGFGTTVSGTNSTAMGSFNIDIPDALLMIGNGVNYDIINNAMVVMKSGNVGIGTNDPIAPLHINSSAWLNGTTNHYFSWATGSSINTLADGFHNISLFAEYDIVTKNSFVSSQSLTASDARVKNVIGMSDNQQDLALLRKIQVTNYQYKDVINRGTLVYKKVIAQQVEEVYPQAVTKITSVIPDIYCVAEEVRYEATTKKLSITLAKDYGIKAGDKIRLVHPTQGEQLAEVECVSGNSFTVKGWLYATDKLFVYGREVDDFRTVDYEALSMLGISAIQQVDKELKKEAGIIAQLSKEIDMLKKENSLLKVDFMARLEALESKVIKEQVR